MSYFTFKSILDKLLALILILCLLPIFLFISLIIYFFIGSPILFIQERPGYLSKPFKLIKFRSMINLYSSDGRLLPDSKRIHPIGGFLRSSSIDELPSLINVLKGELSFIGPRPLLMEYLPLYSTEQLRRHDVMPGFSGWAQVNGRNRISWKRKFELDVWYVDHQNFFIDIRILLITIWKVIMRQDIESSSGGIMPEFRGNENN